MALKGCDIPILGDLSRLSCKCGMSPSSAGDWQGDPETTSNINFSVLLCLYLIHTRDVCPYGVTDFGAPVPSEIDLHLSCKENTIICNAHHRIKKSKAVCIYLFFLFSPKLKAWATWRWSMYSSFINFPDRGKRERTAMKQHSSYMDAITNKKHLD